MRTPALFAVIAAVLVQPAASQRALPDPAFALPPESVTVTAGKPTQEAIKDFVETRSARTRAPWQ